MKRRLLASLFCSSAALALHAPDPALLVEARRARAESVPQVAIQKLRTLLKTPGLAEDVRQTVNRELAEALLSSGDVEEASTVIQPLAATGGSAVQLLQAEILLRAGRWTEALPIYQKLS